MSVKLNKQQKELIDTINGQVICIACPGSGKTTTSLRRINNMIVNHNIKDNNILMITFTKASALEMANRYKNMYGNSNVKFSTIHSLCFELLRKYKGLTQDSLLTNSSMAIYDILRRDKRYNDSNEKYVTNLILDISNIKNNLIPKDSDFNCNSKSLDDVWYMIDEYEKYKGIRKIIDFDDILINTYELLCSNKDVLKQIKDDYKYIIVDETQDLNYIQRDIIYKIAGKNGNICMVGDDDQSIYGFRGARPDIMLNMKNDYPDAKVIYMTTNYRSDKNIIDAAKNIIENNKSRFEKEFKNNSSSDGIVKCIPNYSREDELDYILQSVHNLEQSDSDEDLAILYRTNSEGSSVTDFLISNNIDFYSNENIFNKYNDSMFNDIKAYINMANGKFSQNDFLTTVTRPNRWLRNINIMETGLDPDKMFNSIKKTYGSKAEWQNAQSKKNIKRYIKLLELLRTKTRPDDILDFIFYDCEYNKHLSDVADTRSDCSYEDLVRQFKSYKADVIKNNIYSIRLWVAFIVKYNNKLKSIRDNKNAKVCISTLHGSKGLEWDNVIIINCNHGMNPFIKSNVDLKDMNNIISEERRLFYVGCTRAKKSLKLLYCIGGKNNKISPFILETGLKYN